MRLLLVALVAGALLLARCETMKPKVQAKQRRPQGRLLLGVFGDSIMAGAGQNPPWWQHLPPNVQVENASRVGATAGDAVDALGRQFFLRHGWSQPAYSPPPQNRDVAIFSYGANEAIRSANPVEFARSLALLVRNTPAKRKIVLGPGPNQSLREPASPLTLAAMRQVAQAVAKREGAEYVDLSKVLPPQSTYYSDGLHPNARGARLLGALISRQVKR